MSFQVFDLIIVKQYKSGKILSREIKQELINVLVPFIQAHQKARSVVTDEVVEQFMKIRPLKFNNSTSL